MTLRNQQLRIQNGRARCAADHVVRKQSEFEISDRARAEPSNHHRHAIFHASIKARLRPVCLVAHNDWMSGRGRQSKPLWLGRKL